MGDTDACREVGYSSFETGRGSRPGVLAVDLQLGFVDSEYPLGGL
jgi:hypothetical protein